MNTDGGRFNLNTGNLLWEVDDLQESCKIQRCVEGHNAWASVWRFGSIEICLRKHSTKDWRMERQCAVVYAEEDFPAYNFNTSIHGVKCVVRRDSVGFGDRLIIKAASDREVRHCSYAG